jgi:Flp pilus assembly pilin Flp
VRASFFADFVPKLYLTDAKLSIEELMKQLLSKVWLEDEGEDIAEYAVMLAVILVIVVGTIRLIGSQANNVFSETASAMQ